MSADVLRQAAALMRKRAEAAEPSPWHANSEHDDTAIGTCRDISGSLAAREDGRMHGVFVAATFGWGPIGANAEHIASWHPAVALAVADWLDTAVIYAESPDGLPRYMESKARAVARAYLGSES